VLPMLVLVMVRTLGYFHKRYNNCAKIHNLDEVREIYSYICTYIHKFQFREVPNDDVKREFVYFCTIRYAGILFD
jgi:hypothetical protein